MSIAVAKKLDDLVARVAAMEAAAAEAERTLPERMVALVDQVVEKAMEPYTKMRLQVDDLHALRAAIVTDLKKIIGKTMKPIDPRKTPMPSSLKKLGLEKEWNDASTGETGV